MIDSQPLECETGCMKRKTMIAVLVVSLLSAVVLPAAEERNYELFDESLGVQFGNVSGWGLSYQKNFGGSALQATLGLLYDSNASWGSVLDYVVGAEWQRTLYGDGFANWLDGQIYLLTALTHRGNVSILDYTTNELAPFEATFTAGFGIGVEIVLFKHFSIPVECGYVVSWIPTRSGILNQLKVDLHPQVGLRYRY